MKILFRIGADTIFLLHLFLVLLLFFGFLFPTLWYLYMAALLATLISDITFGYCILSKWEFDLRRKLNPDTNYNFAWTTYYTHKLTHQHISDKFYKRASITALVLCIGLNVYFKFVPMQ